MTTTDEFDALGSLLKSGPLPYDLQDRYEQLHRLQLLEGGAERGREFPTSKSEIDPDMSLTDWLKAKWSTADSSVRNALKAVASTVGVSIPLSRTRDSSVGVSDSRPSQRTDSDRHLTRDESEPLDKPAEVDPEYRYDGPQWSDDDAPEWEPVESLHDALHSEDRGWY